DRTLLRSVAFHGVGVRIVTTIRCSPMRLNIGDRGKDDCGAKCITVGNGPCAHVAAIGLSGDDDPLVRQVQLLKVVDGGQMLGQVEFSPPPAQALRKLASVTRGAYRVQRQDGPAPGPKNGPVRDGRVVKQHMAGRPSVYIDQQRLTPLAARRSYEPPADQLFASVTIRNAELPPLKRSRRSFVPPCIKGGECAY